MRVKFQIQSQEFEVAGPDDIPISGRMTIKSVPRSYQISLDYDVTSELVKREMEETPGKVLFCDRKVWNLHLSGIRARPEKVFLADATEEFKTIDGVMSLVGFLAENRVTRADGLVAAGGGIIQDVAAFACSIYRRGTPWTFFPTTLLSMSDSCIGGKAGINYGNAKNNLGLFSTPSKIIINPLFLHTLNERDLRSGMGEVLKLFALAGPHFIDLYGRHIPAECGAVNADQCTPLIMPSLEVKRAVVERDEFELDERRSLNYGHTFGHALEVLSDYEIPHGLAVSLGMIVVNNLAVHLGVGDGRKLSLIDEYAGRLCANVVIPRISIRDLKDLLLKDKKTVGQILNLAVLLEPGILKMLEFSPEESLLLEIIRRALGKFKGAA